MKPRFNIEIIKITPECRVADPGDSVCDRPSLKGKYDK